MVALKRLSVLKGCSILKKHFKKMQLLILNAYGLAYTFVYATVAYVNANAIFHAVAYAVAYQVANVSAYRVASMFTYVIAYLVAHVVT